MGAIESPVLSRLVALPFTSGQNRRLPLQCQIDAKHTLTSDEERLCIYHYHLGVYTIVWDCEIQSQNWQGLLEVRNIKREKEPPLMQPNVVSSHSLYVVPLSYDRS